MTFPAVRQPSFVHATALSVGTSVLVVLLSYLFQIGAGRLLSPAEYSLTQSLLALYMLVSMPITPVLLVMTKQVARDSAQGAGATIRWRLRIALTWLAVVTLAGFFVIAGLGDRVAALLTGSDRVLATLFWLSLSLNIAQFVSHAALLGELRFATANLLQVTLMTLRLIVPLSLAAFGFAVRGIFLGMIFANGMMALLSWTVTTAGVPAANAPEKSRLPWRDVSGAIAASGAFALLTQVDLIYVNHSLPDEVRRGYGAVAMLAKTLVYLPAAAATVMFPMLEHERRKRDGGQVLVKALFVTALMTAIGAGLLISLPAKLIRLTFGEKYQGASHTMIMAVASMSPYSLFNVLIYHGIASDNGRVPAVCVALAAGVAAILATQPASLRLLQLTLCGAGSLGLLYAVLDLAVWRRNAGSLR